MEFGLRFSSGLQRAKYLDYRRSPGKRFIVHADEKLTAFLELERAICIHLLTEENLVNENQ